VHADVQSAAFLVLTDSYDNGWRVWVDGHYAPLLRADYAFRAVALSPGSHNVKFLYHPLGVVVGLVLSIVALLAALALIWWADGQPLVPSARRNISVGTCMRANLLTEDV
jgi:uncharacterized membrane protein YfhO